MTIVFLEESLEERNLAHEVSKVELEAMQKNIPLERLG